MKLIGSVLLLFAALIGVREYEKMLKARLLACRGFIELLGHIRRKIDGYLTPPSQLLDGFECAPLSDIGYLEKAREIGMSGAYFELGSSLPIDGAGREVLFGFFSEFGKDYKEGTVRLIDLSLKGLSEHADRLSAENEKSLKLVRTLAVAGAVGMIILLI